MPRNIEANLNEVIDNVARGTYTLSLNAEEAALLLSPPRPSAPINAQHQLAITYPMDEYAPNTDQDLSVLYETAFIDEEEGHVDDDDNNITINQDRNDPDAFLLDDEDQEPELDALTRISCSHCNQPVKNLAGLRIHHGRKHKGIPFQDPSESLQN